jgi:hypothetical protein
VKPAPRCGKAAHTQSAAGMGHRALLLHGCGRAREPGSQGAREPGSQGAREPGSQGAREQGSKGAREQGSSEGRRPARTALGCEAGGHQAEGQPLRQGLCRSASCGCACGVAEFAGARCPWHLEACKLCRGDGWREGRARTRAGGDCLIPRCCAAAGRASPAEPPPPRPPPGWQTQRRPRTAARSPWRAPQSRTGAPVSAVP